MSLAEKELEELRSASARLAAQYEVTRALAESEDFKEAVPRILRAVCEALGWELGLVWALDRGASVLRFVEAWGAEGLDAAEFVRLMRDRTFGRGDPGLPGRVWGRGEPVWVEDLAADSTFPRAAHAARAGLHAALAFPVVTQGEAVAVLEFFSRELRPPDGALLAIPRHRSRPHRHPRQRRPHPRPPRHRPLRPRHPQDFAGRHRPRPRIFAGATRRLGITRAGQTAEPRFIIRTLSGRNTQTKSRN